MHRPTLNNIHVGDTYSENIYFSGRHRQTRQEYEGLYEELSSSDRSMEGNGLIHSTWPLGGNTPSVLECTINLLIENYELGS